MLHLFARLRGVRDLTYARELAGRLDADLRRPMRRLSRGNKQKIGLISALFHRPELLILDEPTGGLDPLVQAEFQRLVDEARDEGRTVFLSSHVLSEVEHLADRVVVVRRGRVVASGALDDLRGTTRQRFTVLFAGTPAVEALVATPGVTIEHVRGRQVDGVVEGAPGPLLATLADHDVVHVVIPEPDLEDAFLRLYGDGEAQPVVDPREAPA
jgi:ABC-2 type transport system ATP-binding protein